MSKSTLQRAKSTFKIASIAMAIGGVIGAVAGLLTAPKSGAETRQDLSREGKLLIKNLHRSREQLLREVDHLSKNASPEVRHLYLAIHRDIRAKVAKAKHTLTKQKYHAMVDSVISNFSDKQVSIQVKKLFATRLKSLWNK